MKYKLLEGEYKSKGEYHKNLDRNWKYYPIYVEKMRVVRELLDITPKNKKIIDLGCGEGVLVEEYRKKGYDIIGVDYNFSSNYVVKGDITSLKFRDGSFDIALSLDVLEHLSFGQQEKAIAEIRRILKKSGKAIISIPNLAHFASRIAFLLWGKLLRTSTIERHVGDRPIDEFIEIFRKNKFEISMRKGLFPTYPFISFLTYFYPGKAVWMHKAYNRLLAYPSFCLLNVFVLRKK